MKSDHKVKLEAVATEALRMAAALDHDKPLPFGVGYCFRETESSEHLAPCCAFGHILSHSGFRPNCVVQTNSYALLEFLYGEQDLLSYKQRQNLPPALASALASVAEANDDKDTRRLKSSLLNLAVVIGRLIAKEAVL